MGTALLALAGTKLAALSLGAATGGALEVAIPFLTKAHRVRQALTFARHMSRKLHGRDLSPKEIAQIKFDPTLTK